MIAGRRTTAEALEALVPVVAFVFAHVDTNRGLAAAHDIAAWITRRMLAGYRRFGNRGAASPESSLRGLAGSVLLGIAEIG